MNSKLEEKVVAQVRKMLNGPMGVDKALLFALVAHYGQKDKGKNSYILHPINVMLKMDTEDEMTVAVIHDVVEDTDYTLEDCSEFGYSEPNLQTIDALTRRDSETYAEFIQRIMQSGTACKVKDADIDHNMLLSRLKNRKLTEKDFTRMQDYIDAKATLGTLHKKK